MNITIIGAAQTLGCGKDGVQYGPDALRDNGVIEMLLQNNIILKDVGNIYNNSSITSSNNNKLKNIEKIAEFNERLSDVVYDTLKNDEFPLIIGGDHSIGIGSVCGASKAFGIDDTCVIWIDAHTDINTQESTPTGNVHGMTLASVIGKGCPELTNICGIEPKIKPQNIIYIASRDIDEGEQKIIQENNIKVFHMNDILNDGIENTIINLRNFLANLAVSNIHLSIDIDVLDPLIAPGTGVPVPDGIDIEQLYRFIEVIAQTGKIKSAELVEVNPMLDTSDKKTILLAIDVINFLMHNIQKHTI